MLVIRNILIIIIFIILPIQINAETTDKQKLNTYFKLLEKTKTKLDGEMLEKKIWSIWHKHPSDKFLTDKLDFATQLMYRGNYQYALQIFTNIISKNGYYGLWIRGLKTKIITHGIQSAFFMALWKYIEQYKLT